jgi:hypothetical protein
MYIRINMENSHCFKLFIFQKPQLIDELEL